MTDEDKLIKLNEDTFAAEARENIHGEDWEKFLRSVLADDFRIRRSDPAKPPQDKNEMIAYIRESNPANRQICNVKVCQDAGYGVVTSIVTVEGDDDRFHNIKVFTRYRSEEWQCIYWRAERITH